MKIEFQVDEDLSASYDEQYSDPMTEWREIGGKYKARNIIEVCSGRKFAKVLECGAGEGSILMHLNAEDSIQELAAVEISDSGVTQIKRRGLSKVKDVVKFNGYEIPFPDKSFDLVYCSHVIEHVEYPRQLLREIKRVSELQVFEIPLDYSLEVDKKIDHFMGYGHINIWTPSLFRFLLKSEGYEILKDKLDFPPEEVVRYRWYHGKNVQKTLLSEFKLKAYPYYYQLKKLVRGQKTFNEQGYKSYTCLTKAVGKLNAF